MEPRSSLGLTSKRGVLTILREGIGSGVRMDTPNWKTTLGEEQSPTEKPRGFPGAEGVGEAGP